MDSGSLAVPVAIVISVLGAFLSGIVLIARSFAARVEAHTSKLEARLDVVAEGLTREVRLVLENIAAIRERVSVLEGWRSVIDPEIARQRERTHEALNALQAVKLAKRGPK